MKKLVLPALLALTLAACSSTGPENGAASVTDRGTGVATVTAGSASGSGIAALTDPNGLGAFHWVLRRCDPAGTRAGTAD